MDSYEEVFKKATGFYPFPWQVRAASAPKCEFIKVPTGMGKTAGAVIPWLWRLYTEDGLTPTRLVYCLPMRVLVEQTHSLVKQWVENLGMNIGCHILMGGHTSGQWDASPSRPMILIGTQDMLLSRALNRGYAESRFRWPVQFALLNNDCQWILDEVQLMGPGLATSLQLQGIRVKLGTHGLSRSTWMSATVSEDWLDTVDHPCTSLTGIEADREDFDHPGFARRFNAMKSITKIVAGEDIARKVMESHVPATLTIVVRNTVREAVSTHKEIAAAKSEAEVILLHSRFRKHDRDKITEAVFSPIPPEGRILIATQVIEAGVDISSRTLFTDAAPWPSMVQRFGRCNRQGEYPEAQVYWIEPERKTGFGLPYSDNDVEQSIEMCEKLDSAAPSGLGDVGLIRKTGGLLRRKDILDLFDTTPDLAGSDIDVSRYIRDTDGKTAFLFWRDFAQVPDDSIGRPLSDELCRAPVGEVNKLLGKQNGWVHDHLTDRWMRIKSCSAGTTVLLNASAGGYSAVTGFSASEKKPVNPVPVTVKAVTNSVLDDPESVMQPLSIALHTDAVVSEVKRLCIELGIENSVDMVTAARWHDAGKAHPAFQRRYGNEDGADQAKGKWDIPVRSFPRPGFRHELASAVALLENGGEDLSAYLAAAHHGKVRLSIRSLPYEEAPESGVRYARGVHEGDILPEICLGGGTTMKQTVLSLEIMALGGAPGKPSWLERTLALRNKYGPFKLAFFEAVLRTADWAASAKGGCDV